MAVNEQALVTPPPLPNQYPRAIAGFWPRAFGAVIDGAILAIVGKALGLFCFEWLVSLHSWGLLVGAGIAALYYIPLNSNLGGGRTIGKRVAGTRVVGRDGRPVGVGPSAIRFVIFGIVLFGNEIPADTNWLNSTLNLVSLSVAWTTFYLLVFNRRARQALHDLAADTFVVRDVWSEGPVTQRTWKGHAIFVAAIVVIAMTLHGTLPRLMAGLVEKNESLRARAEVWKVLKSQPEIADVSWDNHHREPREKEDTSGKKLALKVTLRERPASFDQEADKVAAILLRDDPPALKAEEIKISIGYGFDIGIADTQKTEETTLSPAEWQDRIQSPPR